MSALTEKIAAEHYVWYEPVESEYVCICDRRAGYDGHGIVRHISEVTEAAVRAQIAAEITAQTEIDEDQFYVLDSVRNTYLHAARIAGEGTP